GATRIGLRAARHRARRRAPLGARPAVRLPRSGPVARRVLAEAERGCVGTAARVRHSGGVPVIALRILGHLWAAPLTVLGLLVALIGRGRYLGRCGGVIEFSAAPGGLVDTVFRATST